ncbi:MAG: transcriptional repressor [Bacteroidales bacterium]|nr:transcriptional repressor [Bacteroidales bacterium]NLM93794.1 transcriptional repressor [Bacteroidales bacterium]
MKEIYALLEGNRLSRTPCRIEILKALRQADSALSEPEIREKIGEHFDRTTVYRSLRSFLKLDVIHSIALDGGELRYALSPEKELADSSHHVHFFCNDCSGVFCISHQAFETPVLPDGFEATNFDLLVHGRCKNCKG